MGIIDDSLVKLVLMTLPIFLAVYSAIIAVFFKYLLDSISKLQGAILELKAEISSIKARIKEGGVDG